MLFSLTGYDHVADILKGFASFLKRHCLSYSLCFSVQPWVKARLKGRCRKQVGPQWWALVVSGDRPTINSVLPSFWCKLRSPCTDSLSSFKHKPTPFAGYRPCKVEERALGCEIPWWLLWGSGVEGTDIFLMPGSGWGVTQSRAELSLPTAMTCDLFPQPVSQKYALRQRVWLSYIFTRVFYICVWVFHKIDNLPSVVFASVRSARLLRPPHCDFTGNFSFLYI